MEKEKITTKIWFEEEEPDNPFAAKTSYCSGYDVYGDLLGKVSWSEYMYLLFKLEKPQPWQSTLLEAIAIAIALSVTVSIAADNTGTFKVIFLENLVFIETSRGKTSEYAGTKSTSS